MPELPEVETYTRYFARHALHQRIARVDVRDERILGEVRKDTFARKLKGKEFAEVRRHGKHLFAHADADTGAVWLHLHFGMTGDLSYSRDAEPPRFARVVFVFDNGARLAFEDMRLFGLVDLVSDPDAFIRDRGLGPDPLQLTPKRFAALLEKRRGAVKSLLMSQELIAGLGNLYVDEILYQTAVHPRRTVDQLTAAEGKALFTAMRRILREAISRHAKEKELPAHYLYHHREVGDRCPKCGGTIQRTVVFGRTTYFCGKHQR
ncbi:MAG TPA: DNA-formamidopyrimidine glycosylase family protein [Thermoanaerobaculia bacterium]